VTFGDVTDSLARKSNPRTPEGELWRNSVAYRTDQKFDHWLLDEFQDTSRPQWKILKTFIDEVVMDPEGQRSFFYVGDTKQAIYSWRGGDPDLFFEIFEEFNELQFETNKHQNLDINFVRIIQDLT
jgi:ATP-dependent exoDNAse (exonuclease V) beta subunit